MIRILVEGIEVDLPPDIEIQCKISNPIFADTAWNEGYSYAFQLLNSPKNHRTFYSNNKEKNSYETQIFFQGQLWVRGVITDPKISNERISVNLVESATWLRKKLAVTHFDKLDLPSVKVYDEADSIATKLQKWKDHMTDLTVTQAPEEGSHKFPKIFTRGYNEVSTSEDPLNNIHDFNQRIVNAFVLGEYVPNEGVPIAYSPFDSTKQWYTTVSPCIRIHWLLEQVFEYFGISNIDNALESIPEYAQMVSFSGYVLDNMVNDATYKYNVHHSEYHLNDFLPDNNMILIFDLLASYFGAFFVQSGSSIVIRTKNQILKQKAEDMSKYARPEFERSKSSNDRYTLSYGIEPDQEFRYVERLYQDANANHIYIYPFKDLSVNYSDTEKVITIENQPMPSNYAQFSGLYKDYASFTSGLEEDEYGYNEVSTSFEYVEFLRSDEFPDENIERPTTFYTGCIRGMYDTRKVLYTGGIPTGSEPVNHLYCYNYRIQQVHPDAESLFTSYFQVFGDSSLYINEEDSLTDLYHREYLEYIANSREVTKTLDLPAHKLLELKKWKQAKHLIHQRNLSFEGLVKEASFTLSMKGVSETTITYAVKNRTSKSFNADFNDDFES